MARQVLSPPDDRLDFANAKLAFDHIVDPSINADATLAQIGRLAAEATALAGPHATDAAKLAALRRVIYEGGAWNDNRPLSYDQTDPLGQNVRNKLISTYLATRRGNCVSMPMLFLLVGERMGLNLSLATAPLHVFVRYIDPLGREMNLEATSGGHPARTIRYRQQMPMSDRAVESGLYLRTLTRREVVALMATTVVEFLISERRFQEAIEVGEIILRHAPRDGHDGFCRHRLWAADEHRIRRTLSNSRPDSASAADALRDAGAAQPADVSDGRGARLGASS
ncbi:MAG TPA: transglutaminase family protein [Allosphingosinicella sp.]|nr:transglutaminase family protein [Allosphingosinicella sp.]